MNLKEKLMADMKQAMKDKNREKLGVIRMLRSTIKNEEINKGVELDDDGVLEMIQREIKKRKEAILGFEKGGRDDLVKAEKAEMDLLYEYMPKQAEDEEIRAIVKEIIDAIPEGTKFNMGMVMPKAIAKLKGRADGKRISKFVKELI